MQTPSREDQKDTSSPSKNKREPFNKDQYVEVERVGEAPGSGNTKLRVAIYQYGDGAPKAKLQRVTSRRGGDELALDPKGMTADEAEDAGKLLSQAAKALRKL